MVQICASKEYTLVPKLARETYLVGDGACGLLFARIVIASVVARDLARRRAIDAGLGAFFVRDHATLHQRPYGPGNAPPAVRSHDARVKGIAMHTQGPDSTRELSREKHVGELGDLVFAQAGD